VEVHDSGEIGPAVPGADVRDIRDPDLVGLRGRRRVFKEVWSRSVFFVSDGCSRAETTFLSATQAIESHEFFDAIFPTGLAVFAESVNDARAPVSGFTLPVNGYDAIAEFQVLESAFRRFTFEPGVVRAAADIERGTEFGYGEIGREFIDHSIPLAGPSERMLMAFFKISRWRLR
jgi:hypothetical protein